MVARGRKFATRAGTPPQREDNNPSWNSTVSCDENEEMSLLRRSRRLSRQDASLRNIHLKIRDQSAPERSDTKWYDDATELWDAASRYRYRSASLPLCFTFTKLILVVVPSMSTSTVLASKVSSWWSWLRFSPAISMNDSPTTVGLIAVYLYVWFPLD